MSLAVQPMAILCMRPASITSFSIAVISLRIQATVMNFSVVLL